MKSLLSFGVLLLLGVVATKADDEFSFAATFEEDYYDGFLDDIEEQLDAMLADGNDIREEELMLEETELNEDGDVTRLTEASIRRESFNQIGTNDLRARRATGGRRTGRLERKTDFVCSKMQEVNDTSSIQSGLRSFELTPEQIQQQAERMAMLRNCCQEEGDARYSCAANVNRVKIGHLCSSNDAGIFFLIQERCCPKPEDKRQGCYTNQMMEFWKRRRQQRRRGHRQTRSADAMQSQLARIDAACSKFEENPDWMSEALERKEGTRAAHRVATRARALQQCCQLTGEERLRCAQAMKRRHIVNLCSENIRRVSDEKLEIRERCCGLEDEEDQDLCLSEAWREVFEERMLGRGQRREERRQERRGERRQERRNGRKEARRESFRRRNLGLTDDAVSEEVDGRTRRDAEMFELDESAELFSIESVSVESEEGDRRHRRPGRGHRGGHRRGHRRHNRRRQDDDDVSSVEDSSEDAERVSKRECCAAGRETSASLRLPNDGKAMILRERFCNEQVEEMVESVENEDEYGRCQEVFMKCCTKGQRRRGRPGRGRRRRVRLDVDDSVEADEDVEDLIGEVESFFTD